MKANLVAGHCCGLVAANIVQTGENNLDQGQWSKGTMTLHILGVGRGF